MQDSSYPVLLLILSAAFSAVAGWILTRRNIYTIPVFVRREGLDIAGDVRTDRGTGAAIELDLKIGGACDQTLELHDVVMSYGHTRCRVHNWTSSIYCSPGSIPAL